MTPELIKTNFGNFDAKVYEFHGSLDQSTDPSEQITMHFQQLVEDQLNDCVIIRCGQKFLVYTKQQVELSSNDTFVLLYDIQKDIESNDNSVDEEVNQQQSQEGE